MRSDPQGNWKRKKSLDNMCAVAYNRYVYSVIRYSSISVAEKCSPNNADHTSSLEKRHCGKVTSYGDDDRSGYEGIKPPPEPMFTYYQVFSVIFT